MPSARRTRSSRRLKDTLDGVPLEKFRRIVGLFHAVVPEELKKKSDDGVYENPLVATFRETREQIEKEVEKFRNLCNQRKVTKQEREQAEHLADQIADLIHNLHLLLGALLPGEVLQYALPTYRDEYRSRVSALLYAAYENSSTYKALGGGDGGANPDGRLRLLRADFIHLVNELRKLTLSDYHVEIARGSLMTALTATYAWLIMPPVIVTAAIWVASENGMLQGSTPHIIGLLGLCGISGATGSYVSALLRINSIPENWATGRSLTVLRYSESLWVVPVTGFVFAIFLSLLFLGQIVTGPLFPIGAPMPTLAPDWYPSLQALALFLAWSFIAGFAERFVPDVIDRLARKAEKLEGESPGAS